MRSPEARKERPLEDENLLGSSDRIRFSLRKQYPYPSPPYFLPSRVPTNVVQPSYRRSTFLLCVARFSAYSAFSCLCNLCPFICAYAFGRKQGCLEQDRTGGDEIPPRNALLATNKTAPTTATAAPPRRLRLLKWRNHRPVCCLPPSLPAVVGVYLAWHTRKSPPRSNLAAAENVRSRSAGYFRIFDSNSM